VTATSSGSYAFLQHQPGAGDDPVAWDPCRPIHYTINPAGGPADGTSLAQEAITRVAAASGLSFHYDGQTRARPHWDSPVLPVIGTRKPVLISWATPDEVPQLGGDVAGIGGGVAVSADGGLARYATGGVTLDRDAFASMAAQPEGAPEELAIVMHELGHVLGLAHVSDPAELMNSQNLGLVDFGPGDRAGLAKLGSGRCF